MKKVQLERVEKFIAPYRVTRGKGFRLKDIDPGDTAHLKSEDKAEAKEMLARGRPAQSPGRVSPAIRTLPT